MDELRRFTEVDNHEAVKIGDLEKNSEAIKVVGPNFDRENIFRGGPNWHFVEVKKVLSAPSSTPPKRRPTDGDHRWTRTGTQFVKSSTKASRERNGRTCTTSAWKKQGSQRSQAEILWKMWGAKDRGDRHTHYDQSFATNVDRRERIRQEASDAHLKGPNCALSPASRRVEVWDDGDMTAGRSKT